MEMRHSRSMFITWEEAQRLRPVLKKLSEEAPYSEIRRSAKALYRELGDIKKIDYSPFPGHQLILSRYDKRVVDTVIEALED